MNWLIQQGKAEVPTASSDFHQGGVEAHVLDANVREIGSLLYHVLAAISIRQAGDRSK